MLSRLRGIFHRPKWMQEAQAKPKLNCFEFGPNPAQHYTKWFGHCGDNTAVVYAKDIDAALKLCKKEHPGQLVLAVYCASLTEGEGAVRQNVASTPGGKTP